MQFPVISFAGSLTMSRKSTYGLKPEQLADLLSIGIEDAGFIDKISDDKATKELMEAWLITSLPKDASLLDTLLVIMGQMGYGIESLAGKSLSQVILDPKTDIGILKAIKTYSKKLSATVESKAEKAIAITIYYAVLAGSLVNHDQTISQSSYESIEESLSMLIEKKWLTPELKELFSQARSICRAKGEGK